MTERKFLSRDTVKLVNEMAEQIADGSEWTLIVTKKGRKYTAVLESP